MGKYRIHCPRHRKDPNEKRPRPSRYKKGGGEKEQYKRGGGGGGGGGEACRTKAEGGERGMFAASGGFEIDRERKKSTISPGNG